MMLNGTFVVQAINFFCAYLILDLLLFRPVYRIIAGEDDTKKTKVAEVASKQELCAREQQKMAELWTEFKKEFAEKRPFFMRKSPMYPHLKKPVSWVTREVDTEHLAAHVAQQLVNQCARVRK